MRALFTTCSCSVSKFSSQHSILSLVSSSWLTPLTPSVLLQETLVEICSTHTALASPHTSPSSSPSPDPNQRLTTCDDSTPSWALIGRHTVTWHDAELWLAEIPGPGAGYLRWERSRSVSCVRHVEVRGWSSHRRRWEMGALPSNTGVI